MTSTVIQERCFDCDRPLFGSEKHYTRCPPCLKTWLERDNKPFYDAIATNRPIHLDRKPVEVM